MKKSSVAEALMVFLRELWSKPGAIWQDAEKTINKMVDNFVQAGRLSQEQGKALAKELAEKVKENRKDWEKSMDCFINEHMPKISLPKRKELIQLRQQVNGLIDRLDELEEKLSRKREKNS